MVRLPGILWGCFLLAGVVAGHAGEFPWTANAPAPAVAGIRLGDTRAQVEALLGTAEESNQSGGALALLYVSRGLVMVLNPAREVAVMMVTSPAAGELGGVRVGDSREQVLQRWGEPGIVQGAEAMYVAGDWAITVELGEQQQVLRLSVTRVFGNIALL